MKRAIKAFKVFEKELENQFKIRQQERTTWQHKRRERWMNEMAKQNKITEKAMFKMMRAVVEAGK